MNTNKDITGQRFGKLIALTPTAKRLNGWIVWLCLCDCGKETKVRGKCLRNGNTKSCGCLQKEVVICLNTGCGHIHNYEISGVVDRDPLPCGCEIYQTCSRCRIE